jgi:hypothetical protein
MFYFTVADPASPCTEERTSDETWNLSSWIVFARNAVRALAGLYEASGAGKPALFRVALRPWWSSSELVG